MFFLLKISITAYPLRDMRRLIFLSSFAIQLLCCYEVFSYQRHCRGRGSFPYFVFEAEYVGLYQHTIDQPIVYDSTKNSSGGNDPCPTSCILPPSCCPIICPACPLVGKDQCRKGCCPITGPIGKCTASSGDKGPQSYQNVFSSRDIWPKYGSGLRAVLEGACNDCNTLEIQFMGLLHWNKKNHIVGHCCPIGNLIFPVKPVISTDWICATGLCFDYDSDFNTLAGNFWTHCSPRWVNYFSMSTMWGIRGFDIRDHLHVTTNLADVPANTADIWVRNRLLGVQFGFDFHNHCKCKWFLVLDGKGGVYIDWIRERVRVTVDHGCDVALYEEHFENQLSLAGELDPYIIYQINPYWYLKFGGEVLGVYRVAHAITQPSISHDINVIDNKQNAIYYGFFVGMGLSI